jgi:Secretion system C-terminal sorting domain
MYKMRQVLSFFFLVFSCPVFGQEPELLWLKGYGGNGYNEVSSNVSQTQDGGFIVCIGSNSVTGTGNIDSLCVMSGNRQIFLKYNSDASLLEWTKCSKDGSYIYSKSDGGFVFGGVTTAVPAGWAFKILRKDAADVVLWSKTYGGQAASARLFGMISISDGGYIMLGETNYTDTDFTIHYGSSLDDDIAVLKIDSNGNKIWSQVIGGSLEDAAIAIVPAPDNGCYIVGTTFSVDHDCVGNNGGDDIFLTRLDKDGNIIWRRLIGGSSGEKANAATSDGNGGIIVVGASNSTDGDRTHFPIFGCPIWALEVDSNKNILWNNCYGGGGGNCYANSICKATDGSIWIAGVSSNVGGEVDTNYGRDDAWIVHTDNAGTVLNTKVLGSHLWDRGTMIYPLSNGNIIAGGFYDTSGSSFPPIFYGGESAFLTVFAPYSTEVKKLSTAVYDVKIYPNPADEQITIEIQNGCNTLMIADVIGRVIYKTNFFDKIQISVKEWGKGMYFVQLISEDGSRDVRKLIVQ